jgi:hypothetical protein
MAMVFSWKEFQDKTPLPRLTPGYLEEASLGRAAMTKSLGHWASFRVFVEDHLSVEPDEILLRASWTTIWLGTTFAVHLRIYSRFKTEFWQDPGSLCCSRRRDSQSP